MLRNFSVIRKLDGRPWPAGRLLLLLGLGLGLGLLPGLGLGLYGGAAGALILALVPFTLAWGARAGQRCLWLLLLAAAAAAAGCCCGC
jgi:hypothetical protein